MAKDGTFTLTWSGSDNLGLLVRGVLRERQARLS